MCSTPLAPSCQIPSRPYNCIGSTRPWIALAVLAAQGSCFSCSHDGYILIASRIDLFPGTAFVDPEFTDNIPIIFGIRLNQLMIDGLSSGYCLAGWLVKQQSQQLPKPPAILIEESGRTPRLSKGTRRCGEGLVGFSRRLSFFVSDSSDKVQVVA
jgi:hypothetical protein